mmetsp:Transcript_26067/g.66112  ORF Transcript_26067/g.66112 Transcript_26067/m.66112 type:complete len:433 (+) Transcript_26067:118-1416(+)
MPSSTAARVALSASVTRSFFSPTSTSVAPPTLMTAIPPESLASLSCSFSFSYSEEVSTIASRSTSHRSSTAAAPPAPSRMTVSSLEMVIFLQVPRHAMSAVSSFMPMSSEMTVPPVRTAMSCRVALRLSPKPGALMAATLTPPRSLFTTSVASASPSTSSAMITSGFCTLTTCSRRGRSDCSVETFFSTRRMNGFSNSAFCVLGLVAKYGEMKPRSNFMPSTTSSSFSSVCPSCTVITPSLPTFSMASAIISPISLSELAEIVATLQISSLLEIILVRALRSVKHASTARLMPRRRSIGFMPAATDLHPSAKMARVSTVAVVVPSPAMSFVLLATWRTSCAPMFCCLSANSIAFATVTPSLVILGAPKDCSITTLRPFGPSVTCTASASLSTPWSMSARASTPKRTSLPDMLRTVVRSTRAVGPVVRRVESI